MANKLKEPMKKKLETLQNSYNNTSTKKVIVGLTGAAGAGKDRVALALKKAFGGESGLVIHSIATPIKTMSSHLTKGCTKEESRPIWQEIGQRGREMFHLDYWIQKIKFEKACINVVTDVRFTNEAEFIRDQGGIIVRVINEANKIPSMDHPSEQDWKVIPPDFTMVYVEDESESTAREKLLSDWLTRVLNGELKR